MIMPHLFIAVEGLSGSGKTSVGHLLAKQLSGRYYKTPPEMFSPIRASVDAKATALARHLYYFAGIVQASFEIGTILRECPVVCDKYTATMLAYSRAAGVAVDAPSADIVLRPDFTFFLDVPDDLRHHR